MCKREGQNEKGRGRGKDMGTGKSEDKGRTGQMGEVGRLFSIDEQNEESPPPLLSLSPL